MWQRSSPPQLCQMGMQQLRVRPAQLRPCQKQPPRSMRQQQCLRHFRWQRRSTHQTALHLQLQHSEQMQGRAAKRIRALTAPGRYS